jgi:HSP20 family protein
MEEAKTRMSDEEDFPEWFKRRMKRAPYFGTMPFPDIDEIFKDMEKMMGEEWKEFTTNLPKEYVRERKLPGGRTIREWGPFVYGYSVTIGPDGKPVIREFGNVQPGRFGPEVKEGREPLVDVISTDGEVKVVVELPGVEKKDIKLHGTEDSLTITVDTAEHKYFKEVKLPAKVKLKEAKTNYKNGVLEVTLQKVEEKKKPKGEQIRIV